MFVSLYLIVALLSLIWNGITKQCKYPRAILFILGLFSIVNNQLFILFSYLNVGLFLLKS